MEQQHYPYQQRPTGTDVIKSHLPNKSPSTSTVLAVLTLFPIGGFLLLLAGITLTGTLIGLAVATPLFVIFSPVLVPAVTTIGLAVTGFLTSGAFGIMALSSLSYIVNHFRQMRGSVPDQMEHAKRRAQDTAGSVGQRVKDVGQRTQESART